MSSPQKAHLDAAHNILRYLKHSYDYRILFHHDVPLSLEGFTNADWGSCPETGRSIGAYLFKAAGGPISWMSKRQLTILRSSTESEYKALSDGVQEAVWISRLLIELQVLSQSPTSLHQTNSEIQTQLEPSLVIQCDNQSAIKLAKNPVFHARSKHIEIHHHFIRQRVLEGEIGLQFISTSQQPADILTKSLGITKFEHHRNTLNLYSLQFLQGRIQET